ncbi:MAG: SdcS: sodium-dependent dicarboxylate transporter [Pseudomonadota bacterium]|jgi:sodium-dependent dicarboxylate transporter 2/3/5
MTTDTDNPGPNPTDDVSQTLRSRVGLWLGPLVFILILVFVDLDPGNPLATRMAAVVVLMAIWWISEAIPIPATALLPLVLFPLLGIMRGGVVDAGSRVVAAPGTDMSTLQVMYNSVAAQYMDWIIFLFLGGFLIAIAVEKWGLHKRIALHILRIIGGEPQRLVLGFMVATGFLSMWLSNTATTMMMMPMALSLIVLYEDLNRKIAAGGRVVDRQAPNFAMALLLGLAYSSSIGGLATIIGTPPNGVLVTQMTQLFPDAPDITFAKWMVFALPLSALYLVLTWFLLCRFIFPLPATTPFSGRDFIDREIAALGPMSNEEKKVLGVFITVAILWMTRQQRLFGAGVDIFGWSYYLDALLVRLGTFPVGAYIDDGTVSIAMALTLFIIPASRQSGGRLLDWESAKQVPWGILLLFGGGLAVARGFTTSGLGDYLAGQFEVLLGDASPVMIVVAVTTFVTSFTELTSNTATASMVIPIMASLSQAIQVSPFLLLIPTALAASCAFMLPVSTPPNAIVYGSGRIPIMKMVMAGVWLDVLSVIIITLAVYTLGHLAFGVLGEFPAWAAP